MMPIPSCKYQRDTIIINYHFFKVSYVHNSKNTAISYPHATLAAPPMSYYRSHPLNRLQLVPLQVLDALALRTRVIRRQHVR